VDTIADATEHTRETKVAVGDGFVRTRVNAVLE